MSIPRFAASAALFSKTSVLLIRRAFAPSAGLWSLPGGKLKPDETAETCVRREISEELGFNLGAVFLVEERTLPGFRLSVFAARLSPDIQLHPNPEIADWIWHDQTAALPEPHTVGLSGVLARARLVLG